MRVGDKKVERYTGAVKFARENPDWKEGGNEEEKLEHFTIQVKAPKAGIEREIYELFPKPEAPDIGFDMVNGEKVPKLDFKDKTFVKAQREWEELYSAYLIHTCTLSESVGWETAENNDKRAYYSSIWDELCESFGPGEIEYWLSVITAIGTIGGADIAIAEQRMFRFTTSLGLLQTARELGAAGVYDEVPRDPDSEGVGEVPE